MNHAAELFAIDIVSGNATQLTHINTAIYEKLKMPIVQKKWIKTTDGKQMLTWLILPPDFDSTKNIQPYCIVRRSSISAKPILFISMELSIDGFKWLYHRCSKSPGYAGLGFCLE